MSKLTKKRSQQLKGNVKKLECEPKPFEEEAEAAQAALNQLNIRQPDQDHYSSVSQQLEERSPAAEEWLNKQRNLNDKQDAPDDWIDLYNNGRLLPVHSKFSSRSAVSAELDVYTGKAIEWLY